MVATTPEAAPEKKESLSSADVEKLRKLAKENQEAAKKEREKKIGGDGSALEITPEQRRKILEQHIKEQQEHEITQSLWRISREGVREPIRKLFHLGTFAALPIPYLAARTIDAIAQRTISRIPFVGQLYEKPRAILRGTGAKARNILAATITSPVAALDFAENIYEGATGRIRREEHGMLGRLSERGGELIGKGFGKLGEWASKAPEKLQKGAEFFWGIATSPFRAVLGVGRGIHAAATPIVGHKVSLPLSVIGTGLTVYGAHLLGLHVLPQIFPAGGIAYAKFIDWLMALLGK